jgi:hypothetical protein
MIEFNKKRNLYNAHIKTAGKSGMFFVMPKNLTSVERKIKEGKSLQNKKKRNNSYIRIHSVYMCVCVCAWMRSCVRLIYACLFVSVCARQCAERVYK